LWGPLHDDHADETTRLADGAERTVYQTLHKQLQPNDWLIPGQRVTDHLKDHEVDFLVAIVGAGIACLEVNGGDVGHDGDRWWQRRRGHEHKIESVRRAREACYARNGIDQLIKCAVVTLSITPPAGAADSRQSRFTAGQRCVSEGRAEAVV